MPEGSDRPHERDPLSGPRRSSRDRAAGGAPGFRRSRRAAEKARRRRLRRRRALVLAVLVALAVGAYLGVSRIGGDGGAGGLGAERGSSTTTSPVAADSVLVRVRDGGETKVAVLLSPESVPALLVALPGDTLVRGSSGFERLRTFLDGEGGGEEALEEAAAGLETIVGVKPALYVSVDWGDVVEAVAAVEGGLDPPASLEADEKSSADAVAAAFVELAEAAAGGPGEGAVERLDFEGGSEAVRAALGVLAGGGAVSGGIPGRVVEGLGFAYFEPDAPALRAMLGGSAPESAVSVEVQNGSGLVGAAQKVSEAIAPLGYTLLPPKNADGFPDVETTQIYAAADVVGEADRLRTAVGRGTVVQQEALPPGRIVIVVGKDLDPDQLPGSGG